MICERRFPSAFHEFTDEAGYALGDANSEELDSMARGVFVQWTQKVRRLDFRPANAMPLRMKLSMRYSRGFGVFFKAQYSENLGVIFPFVFFQLFSYSDFDVLNLQRCSIFSLNRAHPL